MRKIIVYIAISADGYIARADGSVDWLDRPRPPDNYGMGEFFNTVDAILWGRKTWGLVEKMEADVDEQAGASGFGAKIKNYVFTTQPPAKRPRGVEFVNEPIAAFAKRLRATPGKDIWMMGGGGIIGSFLDAGEIDEFIIHVIPIFIGEGIPLIAPRHRTVPLELRTVQSYPDGVVRLHYDVLRKKTRAKPQRQRARKRPPGRS